MPDVHEFCTAADVAERLQKLAAIETMAASKTAESFLACDDDTKRLLFALGVEDSQRRKQAEEALAEAVEMFAAMEQSGAAPDLALDDKVRLLGRDYGYGALMHTAAYHWREMLSSRGGPVGGEFTVGPCRTTVAAFIKRARQALAGAKPAPDTASSTGRLGPPESPERNAA
jgi:uncharacterized membrane protein YccC